jgi:hypothetical protein
VAATVYFKHFIFKAVFFKLDGLVLYASVLCLSEDGHLSPKHAGESVCMDNLYYINFVHLLVCMDDVVISLSLPTNSLVSFLAFSDIS